MKIIQERKLVTHVEYRRNYDYVDMPGAGFSFPSDEYGNVDAAKLSDAARENLLACAYGVIKTRNGLAKLVDLGVQRLEHSWHEPRIGLCSCGTEVILDRFTNTCYTCNTDYNMSGHALAPREQWGEETGETYSDILEIGQHDKDA